MLMKRITQILTFLILGLAGMAQAQTPTREDPVLARMGSQEIRLSQMQQLVAGLAPEVRKQVAANPQELERLLRQMMIQRALAAEAREKQWDRRPEVAAQLEQARDLALVQSYMNSVARPPASYPSDDEVKALYESSKAQLMAPAEYQVAQIFVAAPEDNEKAAAAAQKRINELAARVQKAPAEFSRLARENSDNKEAAAKGGDLGWLAEDRLVPELKAVVVKLAKGETSAPVKASGGWHLLRLIERKPAVVRPLAEVNDLLVTNLRMRRAQELERAYLENLATRNPISVNQIELGRLQAPAAK
jgi:peptidylprolyl isomerase